MTHSTGNAHLASARVPRLEHGSVIFFGTRRRRGTTMTVVRCLSIAIAVGLLWPDAALAQTKPRYTRNVKVDVKVKKTERTRKVEAKTRGKSEIKPQLSADDFMVVLGKMQLIKTKQTEALKERIEK